MPERGGVGYAECNLEHLAFTRITFITSWRSGILEMLKMQLEKELSALPSMAHTDREEGGQPMPQDLG